MGRIPSITIIAFLLLLLVLSCARVTQGRAAEAEEVISGTGKVTFNDLEGGFYGIVSDDGKQYDPINMGREFQISGLRISFEAKVRNDTIGFHMWGAPIEILKIEKLAPTGP